MFDWVDRVVDRGLGGVVENFVGSVDMGGCCNGVVEGCEVVPRVAPKGGLYFLGMVDLLQGV